MSEPERSRAQGEEGIVEEGGGKLGIPCEAAEGDSGSRGYGAGLRIPAAALAGISVAGYLVAFLYEKGFADAFQVPSSLITLQWSNVFIAVGLTGMLILVVASLWAIGMSWFVSKELLVKTNARLLFLLGILALTSVPVTLYHGDWWWHLKIYLVVVGSLSVAVIFTWLWSRWRAKSGGVDFLREGVRRIGYRAYMAFVLAIWILSVSYCLGHGSAVTETEFLVLDEPADSVVLRCYSDHLICAAFDRETRELEEGFFLVGTSGAERIGMRWETVGPLRLPDD